MNDTVVRSNISIDGSGNQAEIGKLLIRGSTKGDCFEVEWDNEAKVTSIGSVVFFAQYLKTSGLFDKFCNESPLVYKSNNGPTACNVLGTFLLSVLNGHTRYSHINQLRKDQVGIETLDMTKLVSEDSVRRAFLRGSENVWDEWLKNQERAVWEPLLTEDYVIDIDNTVKPLYGHQEGAELGYNPHKPGRPSHNYHTYFVGSTRTILGVDVQPGKRHSGKHSMPNLWSIIDSLPYQCRPRLLRGDVGYGTEDIMTQAESRSLPYLFKLKRSAKIKQTFRQLSDPDVEWSDAGDGWQGMEQCLKLSGWSHERRCIFLRRHIKQSDKGITCAEPEFEFVATLKNETIWEYVVLVTNDNTLKITGIAQLYRDRADCENVFDEIKNQWGWAGFVTSDLRRCQITARIIAICYNWWSIFTRLANPESHMEAINSRPLLLHAVGRLVKTGRRKIIRLTSMHAEKDKIALTLNRIALFLNHLVSTAEQLSCEEIWAKILSVAFVKWLKGKVLKPVAEGNQMLLNMKNSQSNCSF